MESDRSDRAISMHCPLCGYTTAAVTLPLVTLDRPTLRAALAKAQPWDAPQWDAALEPHCPRRHHSRLLLDIAPLEQPEELPV